MDTSEKRHLGSCISWEPGAESEERDAFQNNLGSITTEVMLIFPDSPPSNSKARVKKPQFCSELLQAPALWHTGKSKRENIISNSCAAGIAQARFRGHHEWSSETRFVVSKQQFSVLKKKGLYPEDNGHYHKDDSYYFKDNYCFKCNCYWKTENDTYYPEDIYLGYLFIDLQSQGPKVKGS